MDTRDVPVSISAAFDASACHSIVLLPGEDLRCSLSPSSAAAADSLRFEVRLRICLDVHAHASLYFAAAADHDRVDALVDLIGSLHEPIRLKCASSQIRQVYTISMTNYRPKVLGDSMVVNCHAT